MAIVQTLAGIIAFAVLGPVIGCLLQGIDRKLSARMQGRVGPSVLQPYYDVRKLLGKERAAVNGSERVYVICALVFAIIAGGVFFSGGNLLLCIFTITLASLLLILGAWCSRSPYSEVGASRETLQVMSYEPMVILLAVVFYMASGSFDVSHLASLSLPLVAQGWIALIGLLFILTIKLRKSPFDISQAAHAHQEIVRGMTTEMSGSTLALVEIMHWCESVLFLGWVGMFFVWGSAASFALAAAAALIVYLLEIWVDNNFARVKWQAMLKSAWAVAFVCGTANIAVLALV